MRLLEEILDGFAPEETKHIVVGHRWIDDPENEGSKKKEPITVEFKALKDASEIETLQERAQSYVTEMVELKNRKGLNDPRLIEAFPKGKNGVRILAKAFALAYLSVDKNLNETFWLELAQKGGPIFLNIVDQVDALSAPKSEIERFVELEKGSAATN